MNAFYPDEGGPGCGLGAVSRVPAPQADLDPEKTRQRWYGQRTQADLNGGNDERCVGQ